VLLGPLVLRCLGHPNGLLWYLIASGASRRTEYLLLGHSSAVWLRYVTFHSLREMTPEKDNGPLKRRSAIYSLSLSTRDDAGVKNNEPLKRRSA
jgi:hypothetical protein